ncbi:MAG: hypothetical protein KC422_03580 [Trueperaceae bacterium]|nr:hypothetical protein [Trueperaceae bacterium]
MPTERIYSANASYQQLEALKTNRNKRQKQGVFLLEGVRHINQALAYHWGVEGFLYAAGSQLSDWAQGVLASQPEVKHYVIEPALFQNLSNKNEGSELLALVAIPSDDFKRIHFKDLPLLVVFDRSSSPGNLGTLIRSCDALGADGLIMTGHSVDLYAPETVAATAGSLFALAVIRQASHNELLPYFEQIRADYGDLQIVATSAKASQAVYNSSFWRPTVLLIGNETVGLSRAYLELADTLVTIPMQGSASSLNVACATTVLLYEIARQRGS